MITIAIISVFGLTFLVRLADRFLPFTICPICAGVSGTWIWLLTAYFLGYQIDLAIPALLIGGTVVGLAYQLDKNMPEKSAGKQSPLLWKTAFIPVGFIAAYSILNGKWPAFIIAAVLLAVLFYLFSYSKYKQSCNKESASELKKKMDSCC